MNYRVREDWLEKSHCQRLAQDYLALVSSDLYRFQGGRRLISNTSLEYAGLVNSSESWRILDKKIRSNDFLEGCLKDLGISDPVCIHNPIYKVSRIFKQIRIRSGRPLKNTSLLTAVCWFSYSYFARFYVYFNCLMARMKGQVLAEFLFDASSASNGYSREVHRDSDGRVFVFLLYLNDLESKEGSKGGELRLYSQVEKKLLDPQPSLSEVKCIKSIAPKTGRMIIFENTDSAFHDVSLMEGYAGERIFCYGALTILDGKYSKISKGARSLGTDLRMYL